MSFVIEHVTLHASAGERLAGFELDRPREGEESDLHVLRVSGWAMGRHLPARAVEVVNQGRTLQVAPIGGTRPDVAGRLDHVDAGQEVAWGGLVGLLGLRPDPELELHVILDDGERVPAATLKLRRDPLRSGFEPRLQPLIMSSIGRSGSTWIMKMFAAHPEIVVQRHFPYEAAPARYWMHALRVLSDPANLAESAHPDSFHANRWWAGANPFFNVSTIDDPERAAWLARRQLERLAHFFQETVEEWYLTVARGQQQDAPRYFAEKHLWPNFIPILMRELYPQAREVFLVRDFRDVACSALLAEKRHGQARFDSGRRAGVTEEEYVGDVVHRMATDMRRAWEARGRGAHLVRYEDLAHSPRETLADLLAYLGVDSSPETVARVLELASHDLPDLPGTTFEPARVAAHRSVTTPESAIGRWQERDEPFRRVLDDALGEALTAFGYEREDLDGSGPAASSSAPQPAVDSVREGPPRAR